MTVCRAVPALQGPQRVPLVVSGEVEPGLLVQMFDSNLVLFHPVALLMGKTLSVTTPTESGDERKSHTRWQQKLVPAETVKREQGPYRMTS